MILSQNIFSLGFGRDAISTKGYGCLLHPWTSFMTAVVPLGSTFEMKLLEFGNFGKAGDDQFLSALRLPIAAMEKGNSRPMNFGLQSFMRSISHVRSENQQQKHNV